MQRPRLATLAACAATLASAVALPAATALAADPTIVVAPGDTLTSIARKTDTTVAELVDLNDLLDPNRILAGQRLLVERAPHATNGAAAAAPTPPASGGYVVAPGDNLTLIARHFGVSVASIVSANRIADPSRIFAGQRLTIPGATPAKGVSPRPSAPSAPAAPAQPSTRHYVVAPGDNLTFIARHFGVSVASIVSANGISDPGRIFAGQRLTIPGAQAAGTAPSAATSPPPMARDMAARVAARDNVRRLIVEEAARYDVPAPLALAVAWQESGWQPRVVSHAGAIGIMQLLPTTAEWVGTGMLGTAVDLYDPRLNVRAGVRLLRHYLDRYDGNLDLVLAAYYQGQTAADRHGVYAVTRPYVASIRLLVRQFGG